MNHAIESHRRAADKATPKKIRLAEAVFESPKTTFELEKHPTYDHCPNSTVSELRKAGIEIHTEMVTVPGYGGEPARIARYSLDPKSRERVRRMIEAYR